MESSHTERRRSFRHQLILDLYFDGAESVGIAQTRDINVHGLYLNTMAVIPKGARLQLRLPLNATKEYLVLEAEVVYSQPQIGCAVEFVNMSAEAQRILTEFIEAAKENRMQNWDVAGA